MPVVPAFIEHAADWWSSIHGNHTAVSAGVLFCHLAGLLVAGGAALWADRAILQAGTPDEQRQVLDRLPSVHRVVLRGLALVGVSGVLLTAADLEFLLSAPVYYVKLGAVALLVANGWQIRRAGRRAAAGSAKDWGRLRAAARASGVLWFVTVLAGVLIVKLA